MARLEFSPFTVMEGTLTPLPAAQGITANAGFNGIAAE
jgi:hypothetical protein